MACVDTTRDAPKEQIATWATAATMDSAGKTASAAPHLTAI